MTFEGYAKDELWKIANEMFRWKEEGDSIAPIEFYEALEAAATIGYEMCMIDRDAEEGDLR